ncbi:MAG TPA: 2OG-Fe(II) oxygenase [Myxococcaceae bacterium]|nr:2OG-Fe(II) oxygenase [Myxococcaceae bacterium]
MPSVLERIESLKWPGIHASLDAQGYAVLPSLLDGDACRELVSLYPAPERFRKRVVMQQRGFGRGEYQYFSYPLPVTVGELRQALYPRLAVVANAWRRRLRQPGRFPRTLRGFLQRCHRAGQRRPTPLLLAYGPDDFNCLHADLYGELVFPLQLTVLLSRPGVDFTGGEFLLVEQRPRRQSRGEVVPLEQGEAVVFAVNHRPVEGARGAYRATLRHGVSRIRSGHRHTLGIIFHDAA